MLKEFMDIYDFHRWLRYITWLGLLSAMLFLLWAPGGFPPQAWFVLMELLSQLPRLWDAQGPGILFALFALVLLSLIWLAGWGLLVWACVALVRHHLKPYRPYLRHAGMRWLLARRLMMYQPAGRFLRVVLPHICARIGGYTRMDAESAVTPPKLRLPQRSQMQQVTLSSIGSVGYRSAQEVPAHPAHSARGVAPIRGDALDGAEAAVRSLPVLEVGVGWHAGIKRQRTPNEDSLVVLRSTCTYRGQLIPFSLFVVADGMGGYDGGQEASRIAMQQMMHMVLQNIMMSNELSDEALTNMLIGGVEWANRSVYQRAQEWGKEMGTTLTAALVVSMKAYIVNVGDSRTYLYRPGVGLKQVTRDHSLVATLVAFGEITPDEVYTHPERNKVYRSIGGEERVDIDWFMLDLRPRDLLLLCSDGLWEMVRDPNIEQILSSHRNDPARAGDALVQAALLGGGSDNISVIIARVP